jgi:hypothetical protein
MAGNTSKVLKKDLNEGKVKNDVDASCGYLITQ